MNKELIIPVGISGSGKSTYINKKFDNNIIVCPDEIRKELTGDISNHSVEGKVWPLVYNRIINSLKKYNKAVLDATNVDSELRSEFIKNIRKEVPDVNTTAIVFKSSPTTSKSRIQKDLDGGMSRSKVPNDVIDIQYEKFKKGYNQIRNQFDTVEIIGEQKMENNKKLERITKIIFSNYVGSVKQKALKKNRNSRK